MNKSLLRLLPTFLVFSAIAIIFVFISGNVNASISENQQQQLGISASPTGEQVRNQNQINTQNQGKDSQMQVNTQERGEGLENRNQNAINNMNEVAKQVQLLLQVKETGGLGEQVRQIALEQNQAQYQIQEQLNKLESKGNLARFLTGTDYGSVKNLKAQLVQNQTRIRQLEQLQNQLSNQSDITMVRETIQALIQENTDLQERISKEEKTNSLFGWFFKLFVK